MDKFFAFIKKTWWLFLLLFSAPIMIIVIFAILEYVLHRIDMSAGEWAGLLGSAFSYWGTVILGILAFWQNNQVQENNDILVGYEMSKMAPIFSLILKEYKGILQNLSFTLHNCSDNIAYNLNISDLEIFKVNLNGERNKIGIISTNQLSHNIILEGHSKIDFRYNNEAIPVGEDYSILLVLNIVASDIIGITRTTTIKIRIDKNLECLYEYNIEKEN